MPAGILSRFDERSIPETFDEASSLLPQEALRIERTIGFFSESNEVCPRASRLGLISEQSRFGRSAITDYAYRIDLIASFERNVMLFLVRFCRFLPSPCPMLALVKIPCNVAGCSSRMRLDFISARSRIKNAP